MGYPSWLGVDACVGRIREPLQERWGASSITVNNRNEQVRWYVLRYTWLASTPATTCLRTEGTAPRISSRSGFSLSLLAARFAHDTVSTSQDESTTKGLLLFRLLFEARTLLIQSIFKCATCSRLSNHQSHCTRFPSFKTPQTILYIPIQVSLSPEIF